MELGVRILSVVLFEDGLGGMLYSSGGCRNTLPQPRGLLETQDWRRCNKECHDDRQPKQGRASRGHVEMV